jgi:hypothetical protein
MLGFGPISSYAVSELRLDKLPGPPGPVVTYARAPAGSGYTPQRDERQSRTPAIQDTYR